MAEATAQGLDYVYQTIDLNDVGVAPEQIGEVLDWARTLGFDALNITHPCKRLVIEHLDEVDDVAAAARRRQHRRLRRTAGNRIQHRHNGFRASASARGCPARPPTTWC